MADSGIIRTPFNIEEIIRACPILYEAWKEDPFYLDFDANGRVTVVYPELSD